MERYRSGHNEAVLKTVCPQGRVGSNPTLSVLCLSSSDGKHTLCYGDEENGHCACTSGHLTTANQSEIRGSVSCLCNGSVMVMSHGAFYFLCEDGTPIGSI